MNINDPIQFKGMIDTSRVKDPAVKSTLDAIIERLESFRINLMNQLRAQPQMTNANPSTQPDKIQGLKVGDLVYWVDDAGDVQFQIIS